ncbi:hypothetical protein CAPTEDRAFT_212437 [Capitella teleta]|uniref:Uncharacterized protein n=1 Tax=Capitella teleta TaxID=283909 RepID=R7T539_CAPTE|nr:hypothetical protein CAPTEDRAFT_212437 [Capitella teleta]|eukprot:ELT88076.1 hypothetical protein CAPTEDRAFT_212437 [Capitella teleta]
MSYPGHRRHLTKFLGKMGEDCSWVFPIVLLFLPPGRPGVCQEVVPEGRAAEEEEEGPLGKRNSEVPAYLTDYAHLNGFINDADEEKDEEGEREARSQKPEIIDFPIHGKEKVPISPSSSPSLSHPQFTPLPHQLDEAMATINHLITLVSPAEAAEVVEDFLPKPAETVQGLRELHFDGVVDIHFYSPVQLILIENFNQGYKYN